MPVVPDPDDVKKDPNIIKKFLSPEQKEEMFRKEKELADKNKKEAQNLESAEHIQEENEAEHLLDEID
ncbi:hypothetical protein KJ742_00995 [Patescibacteria group bacterium]|nr:hypothetical protein [Patescibacteria group bacterium]MBU1682500.1 hypothetical protein [Patescibacteria group bacterium]MBU1935286.1 hypothetical protein [Patescibacteria group bacterium]